MALPTNSEPLRFLHTMLRVQNLESSLHFYTEILGMRILRRKDYEEGQFTLVFLGYGKEEEVTVLELTYNWDKRSYDLGTAYGHIALAITDIYTMCKKLEDRGVKISRQPGPMSFDANEIIAFVEDPDGYRIELIQNKHEKS